MPVEAILGCADEHLDKVVVERVVKLALEAPLKLRVVEIARVEIEVVDVHGDGLVFEADDDLDAVALGARGKVQQRMFVETKLGEDAIEAGVFRHVAIVAKRPTSGDAEAPREA